MTLLVIVETGNMTQVLASRAGNVGGIDLGGWGGTKVVSSPLVFQATLLLPLLPSFSVGGFNALVMVRRGRFLSLDLGFFHPRVFHRAARGTSFGYSGVCWPRTSRTVLIHLSSGGARPD